MKIVASVEARTGSTRLPGKVMREIMGRPMLELMIERVKRSKKVDEIVIATSTHENDDVLEKLAETLSVKCYRGSENDVLDRVLQAAKYCNADHIVELWGDTPLIDPDIIDAAIKYYLENGFDCLGTCLDGTFPWGISLLVFPTAVLDEVSRITNDPVDRENVSTYIYNNPDKYKIGHLPCPPAIKRPDLRLVVDELPDLELVGIIFEHFNSAKKDFRTKDIVEFMDSRPELKEINRNVRQKKRGKYSV